MALPNAREVAIPVKRLFDGSSTSAHRSSIEVQPHYAIMIFRLIRYLLINVVMNFIALPFALFRRWQKPHYVRLVLDGDIPLRPLRLRFWQRPGLSVALIETLVERIAKDPSAKGLFLVIKSVHAGYATLSSVRHALVRLKQHRKEVIAFIEEGGLKEYFLASAADRVWMPEGSWLDLRGIAADLHFFREPLARLGVELEAGQAGRYKSAMEMFTRNAISDDNKEAIERLFEVIYHELTLAIAIARNVTQEQLKVLIDDGPYDGEQAKACGLIDGCAYESELNVLLAPEPQLPTTSGSGPVEKKHQSADSHDNENRSHQEKPWVESDEYLHRLRVRYEPLRRKPVVAVLSLKGTIVSGESAHVPRARIGDVTVRHILEQLAENRRVIGVVLHLDTPGGGVTPSDLIWDAVRHVRAKKPVVACMNNVAASGGYYIAAACNAIVAQPLTITGSIGVIVGKLNIEVLLHKWGIGRYALRRGARSGAFSVSAALDEQGHAVFQQILTRSYRRFVRCVAEGRQLPEATVEQIAQGRVWAGSDALEHRLVDRLGGIPEAVDWIVEHKALRVRPDVRDVAFPLKMEFAHLKHLVTASPTIDWRSMSALLPESLGICWELKDEPLWMLCPVAIDHLDLD